MKIIVCGKLKWMLCVIYYVDRIEFNAEHLSQFLFLGLYCNFMLLEWSRLTIIYWRKQLSVDNCKIWLSWELFASHNFKFEIKTKFKIPFKFPTVYNSICIKNITQSTFILEKIFHYTLNKLCKECKDLCIIPHTT